MDLTFTGRSTWKTRRVLEIETRSSPEHRGRWRVRDRDPSATLPTPRPPWRRRWPPAKRRPGRPENRAALEWPPWWLAARPLPFVVWPNPRKTEHRSRLIEECGSVATGSGSQSRSLRDHGFCFLGFAVFLLSEIKQQSIEKKNNRWFETRAYPWESSVVRGR